MKALEKTVKELRTKIVQLEAGKSSAPAAAAGPGEEAIACLRHSMLCPSSALLCSNTKHPALICVADKETERQLKLTEKKLAEAEKKFKKAAEDREKSFQKEVHPPRPHMRTHKLCAYHAFICASRHTECTHAH